MEVFVNKDLKKASLKAFRDIRTNLLIQLGIGAAVWSLYRNFRRMHQSIVEQEKLAEEREVLNKVKKTQSLRNTADEIENYLKNLRRQ
jgi:hypothetical protein